MDHSLGLSPNLLQPESPLCSRWTFWKQWALEVFCVFLSEKNYIPPFPQEKRWVFGSGQGFLTCHLLNHSGWGLRGDHPSCQSFSEIDRWEWNTDLLPRVNNKAGFQRKNFFVFVCSLNMNLVVNILKLRIVFMPGWASESPAEMCRHTADLLNQNHVVGIQHGRDTKSISALTSLQLNH